LAGVVLLVSSTSSLIVLTSGETIPSSIRDPLFTFVQPGVSVWWLVLAGPFRTNPSSPAGIAVAALANTGGWILALWLIVAIVRRLRRWASAALC